MEFKNLSKIGLLILASLFPIYSLGDIATIENILKAYNDLDSYCDTGVIIDRRLEQEFERCFRDDGFFKNKMMLDDPRKIGKVQWSDGVKNYFFRGYFRKRGVKTLVFHEKKIYESQKAGSYFVPHSILAFFQLPSESPEKIEKYLSNFELKTDSSGSETITLEYRRKNSVSPTILTSRLWISNSDWLIVGAKEFWDDKLVSHIQISSYQLNPVLTNEDLSFEIPIMTEFSLYRRPDVFVPVLFTSVYIIGFLFWFRDFSTKRRIKDGSIWWPNKLKMWKWYLKFILISVGIFIVLNLLSLGGGGHPPAIVFVWGYGSLYGLGVITIGCFLLSAHLAYWVANLRHSKVPQ